MVLPIYLMKKKKFSKTIHILPANAVKSCSFPIIIITKSFKNPEQLQGQTIKKL